VLESVFPTLTSISIDKGVMERTRSLAVVPGDFGWNDLGSWESAWELAKKDASGNAARGDVVLVDARNALVSDLTTNKKKKVLAVVGVKDVVFVETDDAVLLIARDRAQDVRAVVDALKKRNRADLL
jgi:mannose-1-phosphate guanylyltransferase